MALTLPKLALSKKQLPLIVGAVVAVAAAGWFGWQYFMQEPVAPPPPSKPQAVTPVKRPAPVTAVAPVDIEKARDKLIEEVLAASGLTQSLDQLSQGLAAGVRQSGKQQSKASPAMLKAIEDAVAESFAAEGFHRQLSADLRKDFDQKRLQALLKDFSRPATKRITELERAMPSQAELARFERSALATRPSPERTNLIRRIDAATRASELAIDAAFSSMKGVALGVSRKDAEKGAAFDNAIEKLRASATNNIRNATLRNLAYSYRKVSDADLEEYAKFCEAENSKWFTGIVYASLLEQIKSASIEAGKRIRELANRPAAAVTKRAGSKSGADARACLDLAANAAIIKCAEDYR